MIRRRHVWGSRRSVFEPLEYKSPLQCSRSLLSSEGVIVGCIPGISLILQTPVSRDRVIITPPLAHVVDVVVFVVVVVIVIDVVIPYSSSAGIGGTRTPLRAAQCCVHCFLGAVT